MNLYNSNLKVEYKVHQKKKVAYFVQQQTKNCYFVYYSCYTQKLLEKILDSFSQRIPTGKNLIISKQFFLLFSTISIGKNKQKLRFIATLKHISLKIEKIQQFASFQRPISLTTIYYNNHIAIYIPYYIYINITILYHIINHRITNLKLTSDLILVENTYICELLQQQSLMCHIPTHKFHTQVQILEKQNIFRQLKLKILRNFIQKRINKQVNNTLKPIRNS
eukprot:TRINITY_DN7889_c0_g1_i10.p1 TRINITY_DN7889_c0_g1~~TRINITY_DN7889_c0_g1_i10.p1  ORF type:complete len:222 (-),score=-21.82 TRINITY_DN7889_c0_g1_i10:573-1238(-)